MKAVESARFPQVFKAAGVPVFALPKIALGGVVLPYLSKK